MRQEGKETKDTVLGSTLSMQSHILAHPTLKRENILTALEPSKGDLKVLCPR